MACEAEQAVYDAKTVATADALLAQQAAANYAAVKLAESNAAKLLADLANANVTACQTAQMQALQVLTNCRNQHGGG
jgi:hypothetical protein